MADEHCKKDFTEYRVKHLELIQKVIDRMATNSATMKRYCLVVVAASGALVGTMDKAWILFLIIPVALIFWGVDSLYLLQERRYRQLYEAVRAEAPNLRPDFRLVVHPTPISLKDVVASWATAGVYIPLVFFLAILGIILVS